MNKSTTGIRVDDDDALYMYTVLVIFMTYTMDVTFHTDARTKHILTFYKLIIQHGKLV